MKLFSNEIVFEGHPDKVCDQIADAVLDECLRQDRFSRTGIEVVGGKGIIFITGEINSTAKFNVEDIVAEVLKDVGYSKVRYSVIDNLGKQSGDIALGVDVGGAGDQGMMFGYAVRDTDEYLPKAQVILQEFSKQYSTLRKECNNGMLLPDGKAQITGRYYDNHELKSIKDFTISYQNTENNRKVTDSLLIEMATSICDKYDIEIERFIINPTGRFEKGGFDADAGVTGRKIVVDTYHSFARVGGGAFSGKDATKVDRSASYKARQIAKRLLVQNSLQWCEVQLGYVIGLSEPLSISINSNIGTLTPITKLYEECKVENIIKDLELDKPIYLETSKYGHFGNNKFSWEQI